MDGIPQGILPLNSRCSTNSTFQAREQGNDNTVPPCLGGGRTEWKLLSRVPFVPNTGYIKFHQYLSRPLKTLRGYAHTSASPFFSSFPYGVQKRTNEMPNNCVLPFVLPFVGDIHASKRSKTPFLLPRVRTLIKTSID